MNDKKADHQIFKRVNPSFGRNLIKANSANYPNLIKYESVHYLFGVPKQSGTWGNSIWNFYLALFTDFCLNKRPKIKVYLSWNLHGDEKLVPNVLVYFAEYLVKSNNRSEHIKALLSKFKFENSIEKELY